MTFLMKYLDIYEDFSMTMTLFGLLTMAVVLRNRRPPRQPRLLHQSRFRVVKLALLSRLLVLLGMMVSSCLIPNHDPGDDVLQFDLRLSSGCFCEEGRPCLYDTDGTIGSCYVAESPSVVRTVITEFYTHMLPPLTRWDAARFLSLAADPEKRQPRKDRQKKYECKQSETLQETCESTRFTETEKSHAFLPLFPTLIHVLTRRVVHWIPWILLPPTYESVLVLVAWWINTAAFLFAALSLHELTYCVTKRCVVASDRCVECAYTSALIFCFNPASVFFSSAYSESLFSMLTFAGYFFAGRNSYFSANICWMMASYTRSNGTMVVLWLTVQTIARCFRPPACDDRFGEFGFLIIKSFFIVLPVLYHDWNGYYMHCIEAHRAYRPMWCKDAFPIIGVYQYFALLDIWHMEYFKTFSVYKYVQNKHWNVGLFRYYQWKQIPNFLLAFPILFLGMCAVLSWIGQSWKLFVKNEKVSPQATEKWWCKLCRLIQWAEFAVRASCEEQETLMKNLKEREQPSVLLFGPILLPYYVVLGAACVVGATIAHVQITTRFIFASCPAIYWYMAYIYISYDKRKSRSLFARLLLSRSSILCYCGGFILAGVVMHPNWLPWT